MVTFTVDKDYESGKYPERYSYDKGELISKIVPAIVIASSVSILPGDVFKFKIKRMTEWIALWITDEKYGNTVWYRFTEGRFNDSNSYTKW